MSKLDGQGTDKEAVAQQLAAVQQQVEQVKGENEELRNFFQEALHVSSASDACIYSCALACLQGLASCSHNVVQLMFWYSSQHSPGIILMLVQHSYHTIRRLYLLAKSADVDLTLLMSISLDIMLISTCNSTMVQCVLQNVQSCCRKQKS